MLDPEVELAVKLGIALVEAIGPEVPTIISAMQHAFAGEAPWLALTKERVETIDAALRLPVDVATEELHRHLASVPK